MFRSLRLCAAAATAVLLVPLAPAHADSDDPLDQTIGRDEEIGDEQVVLDHGHVDIGPRILDGEWLLLARDDSIAPPVWRSLRDMVFRLPETSILPAPADEEFAFIDAEPEEDLYVIPQTENYEVPWLGWNTQDPEVVDQLVRGMTLRLHSVEGPGQFTLFLQSGNFDPPQLLWTSDEPEPQDIWADTNTHVHGNWIFTEPGVYLLDVEVFGELRDGEVGSSRDVVRFAVGEAVDPDEVFDAELTAGPPAAPDEETGDGPGSQESEEGAADQGTDESIEDATSQDAGSEDIAGDVPGEQGDEGLPLLAIGIGVAAVLLLVLIGVSALRSRTAKQAALKTAADE